LVVEIPNVRKLPEFPVLDCRRTNKAMAEDLEQAEEFARELTVDQVTQHSITHGMTRLIDLSSLNVFVVVECD
jgi:hypothetical protein